MVGSVCWCCKDFGVDGGESLFDVFSEAFELYDLVVCFNDGSMLNVFRDYVVSTVVGSGVFKVYDGGVLVDKFMVGDVYEVCYL